MKRLLCRARLLLSVATLLAAACAAGADDRPGPDLFAGYSFAQIDETNRHGADLALGFHLLGPLSGFVDLSGHWGSDGGMNLADTTAMAGPGVRFGKRGGTVVFVRALAGLVRDRASIAVLDVDISETSSRFGVLAGGGIDVRVAKRLAVRAQGDYLWNDAPEGAKSSGFRASAGVVYRLGIAQ